MKEEFRRAALILLLFSLAGCGLKGPLYFPPQEKQEMSATQPDVQQDTAA